MKVAIYVDDCISNTSEVDFATCWEYNQKLNPNDNSLYFNNYHKAPTIFDFDKSTNDEFYKNQKKLVIENDLIYPKTYACKIINKTMLNNVKIY